MKRIFKKFYYWLLWRNKRKYAYIHRWRYVLRNMFILSLSIIAIIFTYNFFQSLTFFSIVILLGALFFGIKHSFKLIKELGNWYSRQINLMKILIVLGIIFLLLYGYQNKDIILDKFNELDFKNKFNNSEGIISDISNFVTVPERDYFIVEGRILSLVNEERSRYGARSLNSNSNLNDLARKWSEKMIDENFFEHSNYNVGENIGEVPLHYNVVGCGSTYSNDDLAECFVKGWIESSLHHQNMIDKSYSITGIGIACDSSKCRATQMFR